MARKRLLWGTAVSAALAGLVGLLVAVADSDPAPIEPAEGDLEGLGEAGLELERVRVIDSPKVTHLTSRVSKR